MLQSIRDKSRGWLAYIIVFFISIPFMFWGIQQYLGGGGDQTVIKVDDTEISLQQFQQAMRQQQQRLREMFGGKLPEGLLEKGALEESVISQLIRQALLSQYADAAGMVVSDQQVVAEVRRLPIFQENGRFSLEKYKRLLAQQRLSSAAFEAQMRQGLTLDQVQAAIEVSAFVPNPAKKHYLMLKGEKRRIRFLRVPKQKFIDTVQVSDEEIKSYYERNQARFMTPERVRLAYIVLDEKALRDQIEVPEAELKKVYEEEKDRFRSPEARRGQQIFIKVPENADAAAWEAARKKAESILQELKSGADFETLAKKYSDDKLSAERGGDLGFVARGELPKPVEDRLFTLAQGEVSEPVKTDRGYVILRLMEIQPGKQLDFAAVKSKIALEIKQRQAEQALIDKTEQLLTLTYENPDSLEPAADALGVKVQTTGWITRDKGEGIAADPRIRAAAFKPEVLEQGQNSEVIDLDDGRQVVVRVTAHEPAQARPLDEVREQIVKALKDEKARAAARAAADKALAELRGGQSLAALAESLGVDAPRELTVARAGGNLPPTAVQRIFRLPAPADGKPSLATVPLPEGDVLLVALTAIERPSEQAVTGSLAEADALDGAYGQREFDSFLRVLESRAEIQVFRDRLQQ